MSDKQFEISYIISLTILILTFLMIPYLKKFINELVAYVFLLVVSFHIILFNMIYTFQISSFSVSAIQKIDYFSKFTLMGVFFSFLYVILHVLTTSFFNGRVLKISSFSLPFSFLIPLIIILLLISVIVIKILKPAFLLKKVKIVIIPKKVTIYPEYEDGTPIFFKIENRSKQTLQFDIDISFPQGVYFRIDFEVTEKTRKFSEQIKIAPRKVWMKHIKMRHDIKETVMDIINFRISHKNNVYEEEIETILRYQ